MLRKASAQVTPFAKETWVTLVSKHHVVGIKLLSDQLRVLLTCVRLRDESTSAFKVTTKFQQYDSSTGRVKAHEARHVERSSAARFGKGPAIRRRFHRASHAVAGLLWVLHLQQLVRLRAEDYERDFLSVSLAVASSSATRILTRDNNYPATTLSSAPASLRHQRHGRIEPHSARNPLCGCRSSWMVWVPGQKFTAHFAYRLLIHAPLALPLL